MKVKEIKLVDKEDYIAITNALKEKGLTKGYLARELNITYPTLQKILEGERGIRETEIANIQLFLGVKLEVREEPKFNRSYIFDDN